VQRLSTAFTCALVCHLAVVLLPYPQGKQQAPQLTNDNSIRVSLASSSTDVITPEVINRNEASPQKESPPGQKEEGEEKTPVHEMTRLMPPDQKAVVSGLIEPQTGKQVLPVEGRPDASPPTATRQASQESQPAAIATAVQVDSKATPLQYSNPKPAYPALARQQGYQGTVSLTILVSKNGRASQVSVHKSSGYELLDNSALKTVKTWRFIPAMENGRRVAMEIQVLVHFKLD